MPNMKVVPLPLKPEQMSRERLKDSADMWMILNSLQETIENSERTLKKLKRHYAKLYSKWQREKGDIMAALSRGAKVSAACFVWLCADEILALVH